MYSTKDKVVINSLNKIYSNIPEYIEKLTGDYTITSIVDGLVNFSQPLVDVYEKQLFLIKNGINTGFNIVESVHSESLECSNLKNQIHSSTLNFYNANSEMFDEVYNLTLEFIENYTGLPFREKKTVIEYVKGSDKDKLILRYKKIRDLKRIQYAGTNMVGYFNVDISNIDIDYAKRTGILQIKPFNTNFYRLVNRYFPKTTIEVEVEIGYNEDEIPKEVLLAMTYLLSSNMISTQIDGISSFSIDGYSESISSPDGGRFAPIVNLYKQQAFGILTKYKTGVVR